MPERPDITDPTGPVDEIPADTVRLADLLETISGFTHEAAMATAGLSTADGSTVAFLGDMARAIGTDLGDVVRALTARLHQLADLAGGA